MVTAGDSQDDDGAPAPGKPALDPAARVVRLPIVPRDAAIGEGRPLSDTAREHGGVFHRWIQDRIEEAGSVPENVEAPAGGRTRRRVAGLLARLAAYGRWFSGRRP